MNEIIEKETGDLYSDCFRVLDKEQWLAQGKLLADQLGLSNELVHGKRCLDGGCGHGALCYELCRLGAAEVTGVDLKPTPHEEGFVGVENIKFVQGSLMNLPFPENSFDLVVSSGVLHHTTNPDLGFSEMARVLKIGGTMILGVYGKHGLFPYVLSVARIFTIKLSIIQKKWVSKLLSWLKVNPIWRYQVLDYLYVPILRRYSPTGVKGLFIKYGVKNPERISNITVAKAKNYVSKNTSYSYDHRQLSSHLLFGHGFIVVGGIKK